jgi:hypothetical protein
MKAKAKRQMWKTTLPYFNETSWLLFIILTSSNLVPFVTGQMAINVFNILTVRMQNVDYKHNRNMLEAVADLWRVDKLRMFYRGLVPFMFGCTLLQSNAETMYWKGDQFFYNFVWPFVFGFGVLVSHPLMLISLRM